MSDSIDMIMQLKVKLTIRRDVLHRRYPRNLIEVASDK